MEPLNQYLVEELAAAYNLIKNLESDNLQMDASIQELTTTVEEQAIELDNVSRYAMWLERRVTLPGRRRLPYRLLRSAWERNHIGGLTIQIRETGQTYQTNDLVFWDEVYDLTVEE